MTNSSRLQAIVEDWERHQANAEAHRRLVAERDAHLRTQAPKEAENAALAAKALADALLPKETPVTDPAKYRAHIFRTEICPDLKAFSFEERFWQDGILDNPPPKSREALQAKTFHYITDRLQNRGAIFAMVGERGTGKTTIAAQIAIKRLWEDWHSRYTERVTRRITAYRKLTGIVGRLKAFYGDFGTVNIETLESVRDHMASLELLVIDELHECGDDSKHKDKILTDIVDRRYAAKRDTILITNQKEEEFRGTINRSILSRLNEHGAIIPCDWQSFRDHR